MKKYLAVLFSVIFLLSFTVTAFAIHEDMPPDEAVVAKGPAKITLGGKIIVRGWYFDNVDSAASAGKDELSGTLHHQCIFDSRCEGLGQCPRLYGA